MAASARSTLDIPVPRPASDSRKSKRNWTRSCATCSRLPRLLQRARLRVLHRHRLDGVEAAQVDGEVCVLRMVIEIAELCTPNDLVVVVRRTRVDLLRKCLVDRG